ncbi:hypothetical protein BJ508DRAFT_309473 [Ascobolus immersus RN42]|uniref:Uncharacterized protein n=1 Tax=Ascobolus immersus RN42 TaxID=1160509 RepID=A0A3N4HYI3_ASCIM|nr:hypothetical protein BJ508DRAFT_309473 [Ascobolus immersus RN42]
MVPLALLALLPLTHALRETLPPLDRTSPTTWSHLHFPDPHLDRTGAYFPGYITLTWSTPNTTACPADAHRFETWHALAWVGPPANSSQGSLGEQNPWGMWIAAWPPEAALEERMREEGWPGESTNESLPEGVDPTLRKRGYGPETTPVPGLEMAVQEETRPAMRFPPEEFIARREYLESGQLEGKVLKFFPFEYDTSLYGWDLGSDGGPPDLVSELYLIRDKVPVFPSTSEFTTPDQPAGAPESPDLPLAGLDEPGLNISSYRFTLHPHTPTKAYEDVLGLAHTDMLKPDAMSNHILHRSFCPRRDRNFRTTVSIDPSLKGKWSDKKSGFDSGAFYEYTPDASTEGIMDGKGRNLQQKKMRLHFSGDRRIAYNASAETDFETAYYGRMAEFENFTNPWFANRATFEEPKEEGLSFFDLRFEFVGFLDEETSNNIPSIVERENCTGETELRWSTYNDADKTINGKLEVFDNSTVVESGAGETRGKSVGSLAGMSLAVMMAAVVGMGISIEKVPRVGVFLNRPWKRPSRGRHPASSGNFILVAYSDDAGTV